MTMPQDRFEYSAIVDREPLKLPGDARIVVWTIVNVEEWGTYGQPCLAAFCRLQGVPA